MEKIILKSGDQFGVNSDSMVSTGINIFQKIYSADGKAEYNHSGIIVSATGETFEARRKTSYYHLKDYLGKKILIARFTDLDLDKYLKAIKVLRADHDEVVYPAWRLVLHVFGPHVARWIGFGKKFLVCSELVAKLEYLEGLRHSKYRGTTPDKLADEWRRWKGWQILAEGELAKKDGMFFII